MKQVAMISVHTCPLARLGRRETGGMNVYVRELSRHLGKRGVQVDVFTRRQGHDVPDVVPFGPNVRVVHVDAGPARPMDKYRVLDHLPEFTRNVLRVQAEDRRDYSVVHGHYWLSSPVASDLARIWGVPLVTMFHTLGHVKNHVSSNGHEREALVRIGLEQEALERSAVVVAASPSDMDHMVSYYRTDSSHIRVIPEGVDTSVFTPCPRPLARAILGLGPEPHLLFVGRIQRLKGIDLLLKAFAILLEDWSGGPLPRLTVVGGVERLGASDPEAEERGRLRALTQSLGVDSRVTFQDAVPHDQLVYYYSAADVVVVPSSYESFGLVPLEAMACGAPVVASRVGGLQWTVRDGETGFLVPRRTPEAFADALHTILSDNQLRARMSEAAVQLSACFSWDVVADRVLELYDEVLPTPREQCVSCAG